MKTKKILLSVIWTATIMLFAGGCGKQAEPASAEWAETVKEADTEESTEESLESVPSPAVLPEEGMESSEAPDNSEDEADVKEFVSTKIESAENASSGTASSGAASNGSASSGSMINVSSGSTTSDSTTTESTVVNVQPVEPTPALATPEPVQPVHTHSWKEHTATKQVWVPNIVVVDDYEQQVVGHVDDVAICWCGYSTTSGSDIESHIVNHVLAGEGSHFTIQGGHDVVEMVKVGSHEEDHGYYETSTYVDYYYCDCGATK